MNTASPAEFHWFAQPEPLTGIDGSFPYTGPYEGSTKWLREQEAQVAAAAQAELGPEAPQPFTWAGQENWAVPDLVVRMLQPQWFTK